MTRRARRRVEGALVLLAFPVAVALTVLAISSPAGSGPTRGVAAASVSPAATIVSIRGSEPVPAFALADRLSALGYDIDSVAAEDNSLGRETVVVYYDRDDLADAERLRKLLGVGTIRREPVFSPSSDVTIFIGKDLRHT